MNDTNNLVQEAEKLTVAALAATSKTPFLTAFKITAGVGLARFVITSLYLGAIFAFVLAITKILS